MAVEQPDQWCMQQCTVHAKRTRMMQQTGSMPVCLFERRYASSTCMQRRRAGSRRPAAAGSRTSTSWTSTSAASPPSPPAW